MVTAPGPMRMSPYRIEDDSEFAAGHAFEYVTPSLRLYAMGGTVKETDGLKPKAVADAYLEFMARLERLKLGKRRYEKLNCPGSSCVVVAQAGSRELRVAAITDGDQVWIVRASADRGRFTDGRRFIQSVRLAPRPD